MSLFVVILNDCSRTPSGREKSYQCRPITSPGGGKGSLSLPPYIINNTALSLNIGLRRSIHSQDDYIDFLHHILIVYMTCFSVIINKLFIFMTVRGPCLAAMFVVDWMSVWVEQRRRQSTAFFFALVFDISVWLFHSYVCLETYTFR